MPTTQGYWTEGKIVNGTNVGGGTFVPGVAPAPAPTPTPTPPPTITAPRTPGLLENAQAEAAAAAASRASAQSQADAYAASQRQARIDAINTTFAPRIEREKVEGDARLSRVAALNLKSGVVGSGVDTTKLVEQKGLNDKALRSIEDAKATAINEAFGWADEIARQRAEDIYKTNTEGANANVDRYKAQADSAMEALKVFGANDVTAEKLKIADPNTYNTLRDVSGMSDDQIDAYLKVNAPKGTYQWDQAQISGDMMYVPKVVNGQVTLDKVPLGFTIPKEKKVVGTPKVGDGVLIVYSDGTHQSVGNITPSGNDWGSLSSSDKADAENWLRQQSDFTQEDIDRLHTDRTFQAIVLKKVQEEKAAIGNPFGN